MHPVLLRFGGVTVGTHEAFVALGVVVAVLVVVRESRRRAMWGEEMLVAVAGGLVGGGIGMHASAWLRSPQETLRTPFAEVWQYGAKSVLAGLVGAYLGVVVAKRLIGYRERTGDVFAPAVALGMAVGRVGCLLTEPPGRPTPLWGIVLSPEQAAAVPGCTQCVAGVALHPSFGYEIAFHLLAFLLLLRLRDRLAVAPGSLLTVYLALYAAFRFGIEFTRDNEAVLAGLTRGQWFLLAVLPVLAWRCAVLVRRLGAAPRPFPDHTGDPALHASGRGSS